jgi:hypothetical protein
MDNQKGGITMPKVYLTEAQRKRARCEAKSRILGDGLAVYKARGHLSNQDIANELGIGRTGVARLISGEDLTMPVYAVWKLLDLAGLEVRRKDQGQREASA